MPKTSAGILLFRRKNSVLEVFLVHPGGPFFAHKDAGYWSVPKGEIDEGEDALATAQREFTEETGCTAAGALIPLAPVRQKNGKIVLAWAVEGDCDANAIRSNTFSLEWPPGSGRRHEFPEVDRAAWFAIPDAKKMMNEAQTALLDELVRRMT